MRHIRTAQIAIGAFLLGMFCQWFCAPSLPRTMAQDAIIDGAEQHDARGEYVVYNALGDVEVMRTRDGIFVSAPMRDTYWWDDMWPPFEASPGRTDLMLTIPGVE